MKNHIYIILCCLLGLALFAPMIQEKTHWLDFDKLNGVEVQKNMPEPTFKNYVGGTFQSGTEDYLMQHFGFREPILRLYNQYLWDFFGKTYVNRGSLTIGKDGWLYEPWAVDDHYQVHFLRHATDSAQMAQKLAAEAKRVSQLQNILEPYGCHLFVCIVPSKDMICPEHLPDHPVSKLTSEKKISARHFYPVEYERLGVNCLNLEQYFVQLKDTADFMLFPQTGTHWSKYGALFAADTLVRYMEHLGGINMKNVVIGPRTLKDSDATDMDLEGLLNLMRPLPKPQYYYATATTDKDSTAVKPKMIVIGDSFWWNIVYQVPVQEIFSSFPYWYYNSTIYYDPAYHSVNEINLAHEILSTDFLVLFYSTTQLYKMHNGFTKKALLALCYDPEEIDSTRIALESKIRRDSAWMKKLEATAAAKNKSLDEMVSGEANWMIDNNWERYYPALKDSIPAKRSKRARAYLEMDSTAFVEIEIEKTIRSIKSNKAQMETMHDKAKEQGKTLEQAIHDDARWIVRRKLERGALQLPQSARDKAKKPANNGSQP